MARDAGEDFAESILRFIEFVFNPLFPAAVLTTCLASQILTYEFHLPQFALWVVLLKAAIDYAHANLWALAAMGAFVLAALPLAWVGFRETAMKTSMVIGRWILVALFGGGSIWLCSAWPYDQSGWQAIVFALLLLATCAGLCEVVTGTLKLIVLGLPQRGPEVVVAQKAHGDARVAGEAEALRLLNPKG